MPNDKPLKPDDFPVEVEDDELMTADGKPIAKAKTPDIAEDIADRLTKTIAVKSRTDGRLDFACGRIEACRFIASSKTVVSPLPQIAGFGTYRILLK